MTPKERDQLKVGDQIICRVDGLCASVWEPETFRDGDIATISGIDKTSANTTYYYFDNVGGRWYLPLSAWDIYELDSTVRLSITIKKSLPDQLVTRLQIKEGENNKHAKNRHSISLELSDREGRSPPNSAMWFEAHELRDMAATLIELAEYMEEKS